MILCVTIFFSCDTEQRDYASFRFVFMTDVHLQPEKGAVEGLKKAIESINALNPKPDFVITGGDLIFDAIKQNEKRADSLYTLFQKTIESLEIPVYYTIGNHDIFGVNSDAGISKDHPEYGKKMFAKRLGENKTYRSFDYNNWHFVLLDAITLDPEKDYIGKIDSTQTEWLKDDLKNLESQTPVVFVTHIPFYTLFSQYHGSPTMANGPKLVVINANEIMKLAAPYNVKMVLQGHLHTVEEIKYKGISYLTGGAVSGNWWNGERFGFSEGFVVVDILGDTFEWEYETYEWDATAYKE